MRFTLPPKAPLVYPQELMLCAIACPSLPLTIRAFQNTYRRAPAFQSRGPMPFCVGFMVHRWQSWRPPLSSKMILEKFGFTNVVLWSRGVDTEVFHMQESKALNSAHPIFLYVGRVAIEKNINAFLEIDLPGSKWVVGDGPAMAKIKQQYPNVNYLGVLKQPELAKVYAAADVFVFPSKTDTFGLVLLEAMACGTPVAAYPVTGPIDVLGDSPAGAMHEDLRTACLAALKIPREVARAHAERFSWRASTEQFARHLKPVLSPAVHRTALA